MAFNDTIDSLTSNSSFYDWFIKENDEIIAKLNQITVSGVTSGDGVLVSLNPSSGLATLSIGGTSGTITTGLTFAGSVIFNGGVEIPNTSYRISGITSGTSGFTFGTVVRITSDGYTWAIANDPEKAEVVGVLSSVTDQYSIVTISGKIEGDFSSVSGGTLSAGCVYFLDPSTSGSVTVTEPTTPGHVSKPIIIGLGETAGIVVPYRGNYLNSSIGGESGTNRIHIAIDKTTTNPSLYGFSAGNFLSYAPDLLSGYTFYNQVLNLTGRTAIDGWFLSGSKNYLELLTQDIADTNLLSTTWEEDHIVGMIETVDESPGSYNIYKIIIRGTSTIIPSSIASVADPRGSWVISGATFEIAPSGITQQLVPHPYTTGGPVFQAGFVFDSSPTYWYVNPKPLSAAQVTNSLKSSAVYSTNFTSGINYTFNGDLSVWQRNTGKTQYTTAGDVYFADNWIRRQSGVTGSQYIERQSFSATSTEVEGTPEYYLRMKCIADPGGSDPTGGEYSVGHVIEDIETFNGSSITVSLYAKCSNSGYSANVYFSRYSGGSQVSKETIGTITLQTTWTKHVVNYTVDALTGGPFTNDYVEIGVDLIPLVEDAYDASVATGTALYVDLASLCVYEGTYSTPIHQFEKYTNKLEKSQRFYYSTYKEDQTIGTKTMLSASEPALNTFTFPYLPTSPFSVLKFPVRMRTTPSVSVYSPLTGVSNEMYNYTATRDLKNTSGTYGYNGASRIAALGTPTVNTLEDETSIRVNISAGAVPYDVINCHIVADASYPI